MLFSFGQRLDKRTDDYVNLALFRQVTHSILYGRILEDFVWCICDDTLSIVFWKDDELTSFFGRIFYGFLQVPYIRLHFRSRV